MAARLARGDVARCARCHHPPQPIALYPHASLRLPWDLWRWGSLPAGLGVSLYWSSSQSWLRFSAVYVTASLRSSFPRNLVGATVLLMLGLY